MKPFAKDKSRRWCARRRAAAPRDQHRRSPWRTTCRRSSSHRRRPIASLFGHHAEHPRVATRHQRSRRLSRGPPASAAEALREPQAMPPVSAARGTQRHLRSRRKLSGMIDAHARRRGRSNGALVKLGYYRTFPTRSAPTADNSCPVARQHSACIAVDAMWSLAA